MILVRFTIDNRNRLIFYGNTVGYVKNDAAVVDEMFQTDELSRYLAGHEASGIGIAFKCGLFERAERKLLQLFFCGALLFLKQIISGHFVFYEPNRRTAVSAYHNRAAVFCV